MAKFNGKVGFGQNQKTAPGVWDDVITERSYFGDVIRDTRQMHEADKVNDDVSISNSISIVSDDYANEHIFAIRYVEWAGTLWDVSDVEVQSPRLLLRLGGVYSGPKVATAGTP